MIFYLIISSTISRTPKLKLVVPQLFLHLFFIETYPLKHQQLYGTMKYQSIRTLRKLSVLSSIIIVFRIILTITISKTLKKLQHETSLIGMLPTNGSTLITDSSDKTCIMENQSFYQHFTHLRHTQSQLSFTHSKSYFMSSMLFIRGL